jgi:hypothetical protein
MANNPYRLALLLGAIALLAACGRKTSQHGEAAHQLTKAQMSAAEQKYGIAPVPDASVTYQPDVIVVGGGAESVRSQSTNGFIWTIDAAARHADELVPGKIFFLTGRAVGRVLDVRKEGGNLVITTGPVDIAELVKEAHIHIADMPINFGEAIPYTSADLPGQTVSLARLDSAGARGAGGLIKTSAPVPAAGIPPAPDAAPAPDVSNLVNFKSFPVVNTSGVGMSIKTDAGGLKVSAQATVHLLSPSLDVQLDITPTGGVTEASVKLTGAAGLTWTFDVGTDLGRSANVNGLLQPDTDFSIPVGGIGPLPFAVTIRQRFQIKTALGVRNSTLSATGNYTFEGGFKVGYFDKEWTFAGPRGFSATQTMLQSAAGISIGAEGLELGHQMKVIVGVGAHGFAAGPYFSFDSSVALFKGSDLGMIKCEEATIVVKLTGGVGYLIPQSVTKAINFILAKLNIRYRVNGEGGLAASKPLEIVNSTSTLQGCHAGGDKA